MRIGTKGRYALTIMFYLAKNYKDGKYVSLKEISENENISFKYLEKIMVDLNKDNYLDVLRGNNGGYRLKKNPKEYTLGEIIRRVEGNIEVVPCAGNGVCEKEKKCISYPFFVGLNNEINNYIDSKTLDDYI
jgi:Rrf2 family protein